MKTECDSALEPSKSNMEMKLSKYSRELNDIKKKVKRKEEIQERFYNMNSLSLSKPPPKKPVLSASAKSKNEIYQNGLTKLEEATKISEDTHSTALGIIGTMQDQRVQLQNASNKIAEVKGNTGISQKYVSGIERRDIIYKSLLWFIIVLLMLTILSLIYMKIFR